MTERAVIRMNARNRLGNCTLFKISKESVTGNNLFCAAAEKMEATIGFGAKVALDLRNFK